MTSALDQKGLEAVGRKRAAEHYAKRFDKPLDDPHVQANVEGNWHVFAAETEEHVRAYLSTVIPAEIAGVVERLREFCDASRNPHPDSRTFTADEWCAIVADAGRLTEEAATLVERLAASQAETRRLALEALEEAERYFASCPKMTPRHAAEIIRQIRALIDQPSTEGGMDD